MIYFIGSKKLFNTFQDERIRFIAPEKAEPMVRSFFENKDHISFDSEGPGLDPHANNLLLYQIGNERHQFIIDQTYLDIKIFKDLFESKLLIIHNAKFDLQFLFLNGIIPLKIFDTFLAEKVIYTGLNLIKKSLEVCLDRRFGIHLNKSVRGSFIGKKELDNVDQVLYSAKDIEHLEPLMREQMSDLVNRGLDKTADLENKFVLPLAYMEYCGMGFDKEKWLQKCKEDDIEVEKRRNALNNAVIELNDPKFSSTLLFGKECTVKWSSPEQAQRLLKSLGVELVTTDKKTKEEKDSVNAKLIESQRDKHPIVGMYIDYKKTEKLISSFGKKYVRWINPYTKRVHTNYDQIKDTGRTSSGRKDKYPNLQQVPGVLSGDLELRHKQCFIAAPGRKMIVGDYAGQESRVLAEVSREPKLIEFYLSGEAELHGYTAKLVYPEIAHLSLDEIKKKHKPKRELMKKVNFAIAYGGNEMTIAENAKIPVKKAKEVLDAYFEAFPGLKAYFDKAKEQPLRDGYVLINKISKRKSYIHFYKEYKELKKIVEVDGFWAKYRLNKDEYSDTVRKFFQHQSEIEKKGLNYPIQGTSGDMTKLAAWYMFKTIVEKGMFNIVLMTNCCHDELDMDAPDNIANAVAKSLKFCMEKAGNTFCKIIPIIAEVSVADWWSK